MNFAEFLNHFISLLVVANPLSALPAMLKFTGNQTLAKKRRAGCISSIAVGITLLAATWLGMPLLFLLGIEMAAFQVAGGIIIFMVALSLLNSDDSPINDLVKEEKEIDLKVIVPLAIPIIAGPGTISTVIVSVNEFPGIVNQILITISVVIVSVLIGLLLYFAAELEKFFGKVGIQIINRLGGLLLASIAVQILKNGLVDLFPLLK